MTQIPHPLIDAEDSVLVVIDVQDYFLEKLDKASAGAGQPLLERICWLISVANWLDVPIIVTAEDIPRLGGVPQSMADILPPQTTVHDKMTFGLADDAEILGAIKQTGRGTCVLLGLETDVCVAHSALGLMERAHRVVAVEDATASPGDAHALGLQRIRGSGGLTLSTKSLFFEWTRTVERAIQFRQQHPEIPTSLSL